MHRTEGTNHSSNLFVDGPPGTYVEEDWLNAMQEEVAYAIEQAGITLKTAATETRQQLKAGIDALADTRIDVADLRRKNGIIDGDFNIWQRGTSFVDIVSGDYHVDRWLYNKNAAMPLRHTISRDTDVPTQAESGHKSNYSLKVDCTTIDAAIAVDEYCIIPQIIEGYNFAPFMGNIVTLSFWVKATKTGVYCVTFTNAGSDRSYVVEYTVNATNTWEKKTITLTFSDATGTWDYINGVGVSVAWTLASGTNFHTTAASWQNGSFFSTVNQVNACDNVANNFWLSQVQFEMGDVATPFEFNLIQQELALCQRYFCKSYDLNTAPGTATDNGSIRWSCTLLANADSDVKINIVYPVTMRTVPTISTWDHLINSGRVTIGVTADRVPVIDWGGDTAIRVAGTAGVGNQSKAINFHYTADAEL